MQSLAFWSVVAFVASIPTENGVTIPGLGSLARVLGLVAVALTVLALANRGRVNIRAPSLFLVVAFLLVFWSTASYFWSAAPDATPGKVITLIQLFVMAWLVWQHCRREWDTAVFLQAFVVGCYIMVGVALLSFFSASNPSFRAVGSFNPNGFAIVAALAIPMAWYLANRWSSRLLTWLNFAYPALAVFGVVLSASRGGLLTAIVALAVIPATLLSLSIPRRILVFGLLAAASWWAFDYAPQVYPELQRNIERLASTGEELTGGTFTGRTRIWEAGAELFVAAPVAGIGFGAFPEAVRPLLGEAKAAHNALFSVAVERGLVGLILFLTLLALSAWSVLTTRSELRVPLLVLFAALVVGMQPTNSENDKFLWFILALLATQSPLVLVPRGGAAPSQPDLRGERKPA